MLCAFLNICCETKSKVTHPITGGVPFALVKLNIVNLNRQSKMYSQGMAPVFRVSPGRNHWERIREKPTFNVSVQIVSYKLMLTIFF